MTEPLSEETIETQVRAIVQELAPYPVDSVDPGAHLEDDLRYDSLALVELSVRLEKAFGLPPLSESDAMEIERVRDIETLIKRVVDEQR